MTHTILPLVTLCTHTLLIKNISLSKMNALKYIRSYIYIHINYLWKKKCAFENVKCANVIYSLQALYIMYGIKMFLFNFFPPPPSS